jgi:zinc transporter 2
MGGEIGGGCSHGHDHGDGGHNHGGDHTQEHKDHDDHDHKEHDHDHEHKHDSHDHDHDHGDEKKEEGEEKERRNINLDAAFLHALGDMFLSLGVCLAATIIYFKPEWTIVDPLCTFIFSVIVFFTVTPITKNCVAVLMEGAPKEVDQEKLIADFHKNGAVSIHDFHLWQISVGKYALSCHIESPTPMETLKKVTNVCKEKYNIDHITVQMENHEGDHPFECEQTTHHKMEM